ncbi:MULTISPECIES: glycoside hydrolase family 3 N-terminal domain-containing protein [unclassified Lentimicrobium]|uniref:glycoside hydrolase family 3 N-terminal domain-containing protein n=1 Tax=unclassified Lentimicrobium TaxID=2677434 RepID=UPI001556BD0E|nr:MULTISPECIES: glycoside hydrolase family 3 N-terminal domain-containing protein [unclassified Lentimicrobium]NPD47313.1 beta-glucosidase [Lentimicrobium sp. S6]NPD84690.1 beta-glucosidase [Lentimicrobium sp. L6]
MKLDQSYLIYFMLLLIAMAVGCKELQKSENSQVSNTKVMEILAGMTLEEKVGQMTQITLGVFFKGGDNDHRPLPLTINPETLDSAFRIYKLGSILNTVNNRAQTKEWWNKTVELLNIKAIKETGIPILFGIDAIHGVGYTAGSTLYPQQIGQGASFNPKLVKKLNELTAYEMRACNIPWTFSPVMDMGRDPRDARIWETYGEDIYLAQELGKAAVEGLQGDDLSHIDTKHGAACLKHFLAYNSNSGKDRNPLSISARELKEIHAASFQAAIDAGAKTIMINSGLINGMPVHANFEILTRLLREEMGFEGMIVTDWKDIENFYDRDKIVSTQKEGVKLAINAGIDMSMVPYNFKFCDYLIELVNEGEVPMSRIDDAVTRILKLKMELGLFETPNTYQKDYTEFGGMYFKRLAYQASTESITLLKNDEDILPLKKDVKVLVAGPNSNSMRTINGGWSYSWQGEKVEEFAEDYHTFLEAVQNKIGHRNVKFVEGVSYDFEGKYYMEKDIDIHKAVKAAKAVDYVLLFLGENSYTEKPGDLHDLYISDNQKDLALALAETGKPIILVLNEGRPRIISKFEHEMDAVIHTYLPANYGGDALADVLFGDSNPSGKLPYTYPMYPNSLITYDYLPAEKQDKMEGLYDYESDVAIQYEFGHGLSYTTFEYSDFKVNTSTFDSNNEVEISVKVTNTGDRAGQEVVMLFSSDIVASISPANKRLRRFEKINLKAGESKNVNFTINAEDLAFHNYNNQLVCEKGDFIIRIKDFEHQITLTEDVAFNMPSKVKL